MLDTSVGVGPKVFIEYVADLEMNTEGGHHDHGHHGHGHHGHHGMGFGGHMLGAILR